MAKIILKEPDGPYECTLDTGAMSVVLQEVFVGASFETGNGEKLSVSMRDNGFEIHYSGDYGEVGFDAGWIELKDGKIITTNGGHPVAEKLFQRT